MIGIAVVSLAILSGFNPLEAIDAAYSAGGGRRGISIPIYEFSITITAPTPAVMSKVATQPGAPERTEPAKFQYYNPTGFGRPTRRRLLGYLS